MSTDGFVTVIDIGSGKGRGPTNAAASILSKDADAGKRLRLVYVEKSRPALEEARKL